MTNHHHPPDVDLTAGRRRVARSRGAISGILLIVLGAWAALVPFIGPYFSFGIEPDSGQAWHWTTGRLVYELLPGAVTVVAGIVLLISASRAATLLFAWLAAVSGAWLVVGTTLNSVLGFDGAGALPTGTGDGKRIALALLYFLGTGVVIAIMAGTALGRLSVHSIRDVRAAGRREESDARTDAEPTAPAPAPVAEPSVAEPSVAEPSDAAHTGGAHTASPRTGAHAVAPDPSNGTVPRSGTAT